jgi:hypothetical protein
MQVEYVASAVGATARETVLKHSGIRVRQFSVVKSVIDSNNPGMQDVSAVVY